MLFLYQYIGRWANTSSK